MLILWDVLYQISEKGEKKGNGVADILQHGGDNANKKLRIDDQLDNCGKMLIHP